MCLRTGVGTGRVRPASDMASEQQHLRCATSDLAVWPTSVAGQWHCTSHAHPSFPHPTPCLLTQAGHVLNSVAYA